MAGPGPRAAGPTFRNYQVAAPLKLAPTRVSDHTRRILPQLSSCGPIEALVPHASLVNFTGPSATIKLRPH